MNNGFSFFPHFVLTDSKYANRYFSFYNFFLLIFPFFWNIFDWFLYLFYTISRTEKWTNRKQKKIGTKIYIYFDFILTCFVSKYHLLIIWLFFRVVWGKNWFFVVFFSFIKWKLKWNAQSGVNMILVIFFLSFVVLFDKFPFYLFNKFLISFRLVCVLLVSCFFLLFFYFYLFIL